MSERNVPDMKLRLPPDLRQKIEEAARAENRSLNGEIVLRLTQSFETGETVAASDFVTGQQLAMLEAEVENLREIIRGVDNRLSALAANSK